MLNNEKPKVLIVDDSVLIRKYVSQIISELDMEVVGTAANGKIALQKMYIYKPDIIILDLEMPEMNGIELLKHLKNDTSINPKPYIILFSSQVGDSFPMTFEALSLGAVDFIKKPEGIISENIELLKKEFYIKIYELHKTKKDTTTKKINNNETFKNEKDNFKDYDILFGLNSIPLLTQKKRIKPQIIAIGSSTGGPNAIRKIIEVINPLPVPMIIAQHMPAGFTFEFAKNLSGIYKKNVKEISDGEALEKNTIYICPGGYHAKISIINNKLCYQMDKNNYEGFFFKPSVDLFLKSIYETIAENVIVIILSGMGKDGSTEVVNLRKKGAIVIAQNKESSVVWGMPGNAVKNGGVDIVLDISEIGPAINQLINYYFNN